VFCGAVSNPCFELWLLLHHADRRAAAHRCQEIEQALRKVLPRYRKANLRFTDFADRLDVAVHRARQLDAAGGPLPNPSSGVWRLVEAMTGKP
jgi:hypothetical protein